MINDNWYSAVVQGVIESGRNSRESENVGLTYRRPLIVSATAAKRYCGFRSSQFSKEAENSDSCVKAPNFHV